ncbi:hypothetical protein N9F34_03850 [Alphaproteobacteria bacterium]|nr:hypothetical protein [Alphaproteobacteria bacterium]
MNNYKTCRLDPDQIGLVISKAKMNFPNRNVQVITDLPHLIGVKLDIPPIRFVAEESFAAKMTNIEIDDCVFVLIFDCDDSAAQAAEYCIDLKIPFLGGGINGTALYIHVNRQAKHSLFEVKGKINSFGQGHFDAYDFMNIAQAIEITKDLTGYYVEVGVFNGSSGMYALNYMNRVGMSRPCVFLDLFEGFNFQEAKESADAFWYGTHKDQKPMEVVQAQLQSYADPANGLSVRVEKNNIISDPLPDDLDQIVVANLDVDMFDSVYAGLLKLAPRIVPKGIIIAEDAGHSGRIIGARVAVNKFLRTKVGLGFMPIVMESGQTFLVKVG